MKGDDRLINIRHNGGDVQRLPRARAEVLVESGKARFISNTLFKAAQAGVKVEGDLSDTEVKELIRKARKPEPKKETSDEQSEQESEPKKSKKRRKGSRSR